MLSKAIKYLLLIFTVCILSCSISFAADTNHDNNSSLSESLIYANSTVLKTAVLGVSTLSAEFSAESNKPSKISQDDVFKVSTSAKKYVDSNGKLPKYVTISGYNYSMPEYLYLISRTISLKSSNSQNQVTVKYDTKNPTSPSGVSINKDLSKSTYNSLSKKVYDYIDSKNTAPNYVSSPYGNIQYQSILYGFIKIGNWYNQNGKKLPVYLTLNVKKTSDLNKNLPTYTKTSSSDSSSSSSSSNPSSGSSVNEVKLSLTNIFKASSTVKTFTDKNSKLPNYVTISGEKYSMPDFFHVLSKAITVKSSNSTNQVSIKINAKNPTKPSGKSISYNLSKSEYLRLAKNIYTYIESKNTAPNYATSSMGEIQYQTILWGLAKVGDWYSKNGKFPTSVGLDKKYTKSINNYLPLYTSNSSSTNSSNSVNNSSGSNSTNSGSDSIIGKVKFTNKNAMWVHSGDMNNVVLKTLVSAGIGNVFLHEDVFKEFGETKVLAWIKNANNLGVKTHIWITVFYNTSSKKWINPINVNNNSYDYSLFNTIISKAVKYSKMSSVAGVHLDYLRYPGTAYKNNYSNGVTGTGAINEFTKLLYTSVKKVNPNILLSAAVMPEASKNTYYYGQDTNELGKYLDVVVPMIYKGNYNKDSSWITSTVKWFVANSNDAEVWAGLQTYKSDSNVEKLSTSELIQDCKAALNGGSLGLVLFRWGITNIFNLINL
ncbi:pseudomurein-binding repeat-containing protein [Methanobrevibacter filiformis]|uniref:Pseudomurein-binding repeat protein n=1 Tax=Methanobrevibacter filiformis TaxID=55758 RepID=A0A166DB95_9EURY|nr:pseudomurein-binding repeat-containing protein [Methanobrevibacter filiformis]KZX15403.1 pseudomurein-binding repeat protein [Methanobrevibacter filiformis]